jgi:hypothetical protein
MSFSLTPAGEQACHVVQPGDLGLLVTQHIAQRFNGDRAAAVRAAIRQVTRILGIPGWRRWPAPEQVALQRLSPILALIPDLARWTPAEERSLVRLIRAKGGQRESEYVRLLQAHARLRQALVDLARLAASPAPPAA